MTAQVIRIGPRGGHIVKDTGKRPEYQRQGDLFAPHAPEPEDPNDIHTPHDAACFNETMRHGKEVMVVYEGHGEKIETRKGSEGGIKLDDVDQKKWRRLRLHLTHSHPTGASFSGADVQTLFDFELASIRAVAITREDGAKYAKPSRTYSLSLNIKTLTADGFHCLRDSHNARRAWEQEVGRDLRGWTELVTSGKIDADRAWVTQSHTAMARLARRLGLHYEVIGAPVKEEAPHEWRKA